jgi:hypothetical protein
MENRLTPATGPNRLTRSLMASTCLTMVSATGAMATTFNESSAPGGVFPNTGPGFALPVGTTIVNGSLFGENVYNFFEFTGLPAGELAVFGSTSPGGQFGDTFSVFTSGLSLLTEGALPTALGFLDGGVVPPDGDLVIGVGSHTETASNYTIEIEVVPTHTESPGLPGVPEPSGLLGTGLAVAAGALAWRRRRAGSPNRVDSTQK